MNITAGWNLSLIVFPVQKIENKIPARLMILFWSGVQMVSCFSPREPICSNTSITQVNSMSTKITTVNGNELLYYSITPFANLDYFIDSSKCIIYFNCYTDSLVKMDLFTGSILNSFSLSGYCFPMTKDYKIFMVDKFLIFQNSDALLLLSDKLSMNTNILEEIKIEQLNLDRPLVFDWHTTLQNRMLNISVSYREGHTDSLYFQSFFIDLNTSNPQVFSENRSPFCPTCH
ncbi:MAG: hypothetical protein R3C61_18090 [Bacteroidia bacterium]